MTEDHDLVVTDEFFDYLAQEVERPARIPDPEMVDWFRRMLPTIEMR